MSIPADIAVESRAILEERRERRAAAEQRLREQIAKKAPEALELERDIATTSARLAKAVLGGGDLTDQLTRIRDFNLSAQRRLGEVLTNAGFEADALQPHPVCPQCGDTGVDGVAVCGCLRQIQKELMYRRLGASAPVEDCGFDRFDLNYYSPTPESGTGEMSARAIMAHTLRQCRKYADELSSSSPSLLLFGGPGLGKTHLSLSIAKAAVEKRMDVFYAPFQALLSRLEAAQFGRGERDFLALLDAPLNCELLILDDLGSEFFTPFGQSVLYNLINSRLIAPRPTIISTNLDNDALEARYGDRIASRLFGCYQALPFVGEDVRMQKMYSK